MLFNNHNNMYCQQHIARYAGDVIDDNGDNLRSNQLPRALKEIYILLQPYVRIAHMIIIVLSLLSKQAL
jgi:hypothetical protein